MPLKARLVNRVENLHQFYGLDRTGSLLGVAMDSVGCIARLDNPDRKRTRNVYANRRKTFGIASRGRTQCRLASLRRRSGREFFSGGAARTALDPGRDCKRKLNYKEG